MEGVKSRAYIGGGELGIFPSPKAFLKGEALGIFPSPLAHIGEGCSKSQSLYRKGVRNIMKE